MNNITVIIPTAGLGSRLGVISQFINKSLVSYKHKPVLSHIIEQFPKDTKFIIPIGYNKQQVKDFCELTYSDRNIEFVDIEHYKQSWTGPGYTITQCLVRSFIVHVTPILMKIYWVSIMRILTL
jgi:NDP-sugar pyrophosphorylase family protein